VNRSRLTRFAWLSIAAAVITIALKTAAYFITGSVGLLSDAVESIVNLVGGIMALAGGGYAGDYAAGGKLLDGPGDGVSDSIPAVIQGPKPQRAALADGEFVVPARIVSELGNGSTKAGAKRLYAMMDRVQNARGKTVGKNKVAVDTKPEKFLPA